MIPWGAYRLQMRRSLLRDDSQKQQRWTDENLLDALGWALDTFSAHTALPKTMVSTVDGVSSSITLPHDIYDDTEQTVLVRLVTPDRIEILEPIRLVPGVILDPPEESNSGLRGYWEWPTGTLNFGFVPEKGSRIELMYFAYYPSPESDEDILQIPRWAHLPVGYLIGAYAVLSYGVVASQVRQYADKQDSGTPEHNPLHRQTEHFLRLYRETIARYPAQNRGNYFQKGFKL